jgi:DNA (cytosine-5)-methyltransferase 1
MGKYEIEFIEVKVLARQPNNHVLVRGIPFARNRGLMGKLPKKQNEVCKILHFKRSTDTGANTPLTVDVSEMAIINIHRLVYTNAIWPQYSNARRFAMHTPNRAEQIAEREASGMLVCRWKLKVFFKLNGRKTQPEEEVLERIHSSEVSDARYKVSDDVLCNRWRGGRIRGGSWSPGADHGIIDLENTHRCHSSDAKRAHQKYTLFDSFSGAGGVSRGAQTAGLKVSYAVDSSPDVWDTYRSNFPDAQLFRMTVDEFIKESNTVSTRVDFLHLSPPCQYFSPAHTRECANDDANIFALFGCNELIKRTKPRLITLEQTFGITHERHSLYLQALIRDLTQFGYSVRWKVVQLKTWGSAQDRKRLIVLAAAPGEKLPPFPKATHSDDPEDGLIPLNTIGRALAVVRVGDDLHDLDDVKHHHPPRPSYSPDRLAMTITTGCREMYFPDGTRDLTLRELASLQGFPRRHRFQGTKTSVRRQIGNAFPPNTVHTLYKHLREWLEKEDGVVTREPPRTDIIMIDAEPETQPARASTSGSISISQDRANREDLQVIDLT